jgi:hypothetical protein
MVIRIGHVKRFQIDQKMSDRSGHISSSAGDFCAEENIPILVKKQTLFSQIHHGLIRLRFGLPRSAGEEPKEKDIIHGIDVQKNKALNFR